MKPNIVHFTEDLASRKGNRPSPTCKNTLGFSFQDVLNLDVDDAIVVNVPTPAEIQAVQIRAHSALVRARKAAAVPHERCFRVRRGVGHTKIYIVRLPDRREVPRV
jgi:hypothetical protein